MAAIPASEQQADSADAVLAAVREARAAADREEVRILELAREWAAMHEIDDAASPLLFEQPARLTGEGVPEVGEFCVPELATVLHISTEAAGSLIAVRPGRPDLRVPVVHPPGPAHRLRPRRPSRRRRKHLYVQHRPTLS